MLLRRVCSFLLIGFCVGVVAQGQAKHPFGVKDWSTLRNAAPIAVAMDGSILYRVGYGDDHGPTHREWWTIGADGTNARKIAIPDDFSPVGFTRDGQSLYGTWKVNKQPQFAIFALKEAKLAATPSTIVVLPKGIGGIRPSPDGRRFAILADPRQADPRDSFREVAEPEQSSIYVVHADGTGGAWWCTNLNHVASSLSVGGSESAIAWNAEGSELAAISTVPKLLNHELHASIDVCSAAGSRHVTDIGNSVNGLAWTDGDKELVFLSTKTETQTPEHVWAVKASGGAAEDLTPKLDGTAQQLTGDAEGRVWVVVNHGVRNEVDEFKNGELKNTYEWPDGVVGDIGVRPDYPGAGTHVAFDVSDPTHAFNVAIADGNSLKMVTHEGEAQLANDDLGPVRVVRWTSKGGVKLEGIVTFPAGYVEGKKYPLIVHPHGGPEGNDELLFDARARMLAGFGYVVFQPEYRGSTGYGEAFMQSIYQHFGDRAYEDVDSATDFAIAQGWADPNRLAIFGWSAGGFMTSWTVTQTGRYKAAIEGAGITDWEPFLWTSDVPQTDYDARWTDENPEAFRKFSAVYYASKVTTPLLILHGEADARVPYFQGVEYFAILAARGKTVRMVSYPGSGHFPSQWEQRINVFEEVGDWLKKYNP
jgi:dipeptidyl aminopeptidase/acylaminoacyl peptidase